MPVKKVQKKKTVKVVRKKTDEKHKGGRPTKLTQKIIKETRKYIESHSDEYEFKVVQNPVKKKDGKKRQDHVYKRVKIPTVEGLAIHLGVSRSTIYEWIDDIDSSLRQEFSDTVERLKAIQAERLISNGLEGIYTPTITKLLLHAHGYTERTQIDLSGEMKVERLKDIEDTTREILEASKK